MIFGGQENSKIRLEKVPSSILICGNIFKGRCIATSNYGTVIQLTHNLFFSNFK